VSEITDAELQELIFGSRPCGKCDFCIDGQECREGLGTTPTEKRLLERLERVESEKTKFRHAIRNHRDQRGDDRCYLDDAELYSVLGESEAVTVLPPKEVFLANCARFHASRQKPGEKYETEEERHQDLKTKVAELEAKIFDWQLALHAVVPGFHYDVNPSDTLAPKDVAACFKVLLEERDRLHDLILEQEWSGILDGCTWCKSRREHEKSCPMFEAKGVVRFGSVPLSE